MAHKILVSAPVPLELILIGFDWVGAGPWGFGDLGRGLTISVKSLERKQGTFLAAEQFPVLRYFQS